MTTTGSGVALLRYAGFMTWALAGLPLTVRLFKNPALLGEPRYWLWLTWFAVFGVAFALTAWRTTPAASRWRQLISLAIQTMAALAMIELVCSGHEGALLVIVAAQLGWVLPLGRALIWVAVQALIMCAILALSWPNDVTLRLMSMFLGFQVLALFSCFLTAREATARASLDRTNLELQATRELLASTARLAERERISRELHDALGHHLTALSLNLEAARHMPAEEALQQVSRAQDITRSLLTDVREVVSTLREGSPLQLREALLALVESVPEPLIHLKLPDHVAISDPVIAHTLLRCVQETVTNAIRHAHAANLWIEFIESNGRVEVRAVDDGSGTEQLQLGRGLAGMRERVEAIGGRLAIQSHVGKGFDLSVSIPLSTDVP